VSCATSNNGGAKGFGGSAIGTFDDIAHREGSASQNMFKGNDRRTLPATWLRAGRRICEFGLMNVAAGRSRGHVAVTRIDGDGTLAAATHRVLWDAPASRPHWAADLNRLPYGLLLLICPTCTRIVATLISRRCTHFHDFAIIFIFRITSRRCT
jgi:hypothetical protein